MADPKSSSSAPKDTATPSTGGGLSPLSFFRRRSGRPAGPLSSTSRFILGSVLFIFTAELLTYAIDYANIQFKLGLMQPIFPGASWLTWFLILNVLIILGVWLLLRRVGLLPTDMFGAQRAANLRNAQSSSSASSSSNGSKKTGAAIPGIGKTRTRAERRYTATMAAAEAAAAAAKAKGKRSTTASATKPADASQQSANGDYNEAYDRARAAQRMRKRRALR